MSRIRPQKTLRNMAIETKRRKSITIELLEAKKRGEMERKKTKNKLWSNCKDQGLKLWECPPFLFLVTGGTAMVFMLLTYVIASKYASTEMTIVSLTLVTLFMLIISFISDRTMTKVAVARMRLKQSNYQLQVAFQNEKNAERLRKEFTSMIVHDLKSPLKGIYYLAETIKKIRGITSLKECSLSGKSIQTSSEKMLKLINSILIIDKIEAGKFIIDKKKGQIEKLLKDELKMHEPLAKAKNIALNLMIPLKLPQVKFDKQNVERILGNLLTNAIKYTEQNGSVDIQAFLHMKGHSVLHEANELRLHWMCTKNNKHFHRIPKSIIIALTDNGPGIKKENIERIFDRFHQAASKKITTHDGTGLGLTIARNISEAHGGVMGVESKPKKGSTFYFTIPV